MLRLLSRSSLLIEVDVPAGTVAVQQARPGQPGLVRIKLLKSKRLTGISSSGDIDCHDFTPLLAAKLVKALRESGQLFELEAVIVAESGQEECVDVHSTNLTTALSRMFGITRETAYAAMRQAGLLTNTISSIVRSCYEGAIESDDAVGLDRMGHRRVGHVDRFAVDQDPEVPDDGGQ